jgi:hypothetical protein
LRFQQPLLSFPPHRPQQKHPLVGDDRHIAAAGLDAAVDYQQVAVVDAMAAQPMAADPHEKAADRIGHQGRVQIQSLRAGADTARDRLPQGQLGQHHPIRNGTDVLLPIAPIAQPPRPEPGAVQRTSRPRT